MLHSRVTLESENLRGRTEEWVNKSVPPCPGQLDAYFGRDESLSGRAHHLLDMFTSGPISPCPPTSLLRQDLAVSGFSSSVEAVASLAMGYWLWYAVGHVAPRSHFTAHFFRSDSSAIRVWRAPPVGFVTTLDSLPLRT